MITDFSHRSPARQRTIREAGDLLLSTSQQDFPVMHGDEVVGLLTRSALMRGMLREGPDAYVAGVMERNFPRVPPDMDLAAALPILSCRRFWRAGDGRRSTLLFGTADGAEFVRKFMLLRRVSIAQAKMSHH